MKFQLIHFFCFRLFFTRLVEIKIQLRLIELVSSENQSRIGLSNKSQINLILVSTDFVP